MQPLWIFVALLATHWVADFILQTHWQATNKSRRIDALAQHVLTYWAALAVVSPIFLGLLDGLFFAAVNGFLHFCTDYCTSRWTARLYAKKGEL